MMRLFWTINLLLLAGAAWAQEVYKWVDENGEVHYSQTLPPEQVEREHERLTGEGILAERVERAPTEAERAALQARLEAERDRAEQERIREQQNRLFLAAFPTEEDIRRAIESRRQTVEAERASVKSLIEQTRQRFEGLVRRAAELERAGKPVPAHIRDRIGYERKGLKELNERLATIDQRLEALDQELAADLERHRRLTDSG